jgi:hypothetical protein
VAAEKRTTDCLRTYKLTAVGQAGPDRPAQFTALSYSDREVSPAGFLSLPSARLL